MIMNKQETIVRGDFEVKLEPEELHARGGRLVELHKEIDDLSAEIRSFTSDKKTEIRRRKEEMTRVLETMRSGYEMRTLLAREVKDFDVCTICYYEKDTGKVLKKRVMDAAERQMGLELEPDDDAERMGRFMRDGEEADDDVASDPPA